MYHIRLLLYLYPTPQSILSFRCKKKPHFETEMCFCFLSDSVKCNMNFFDNFKRQNYCEREISLTADHSWSKFDFVKVKTEEVIL